MGSGGAVTSGGSTPLAEEHRKPWETPTPPPLGDLASQGRGFPKSPSSSDGRPETRRTWRPDSGPLFLAITSPMFFILAVLLTISVQFQLMHFLFNSCMLTHPGKL